jgi:hypothetical protein
MCPEYFPYIVFCAPVWVSPWLKVSRVEVSPVLQNVGIPGETVDRAGKDQLTA